MSAKAKKENHSSKGPRGGARDVILQTAERLFAERGLDAVSLRAINAEAGYSAAALHYHFGTRDELVLEILKRRVRPLLELRGQLLTFLEPPVVPEVKQIARALVLPMARPIMDDRVAGLRTVNFLFKVFLDPVYHDDVIKMVNASYAIFGELLAMALPQLPPEVLLDRWGIASELTFQGLTRIERMPDDCDLNSVVERLIEFIAGGLSAPYTPTATHPVTPPAQSPR